MEDKIQAAREMNDIYASLGITSLLNPGEDRDNVAALEELWRRKQMTVRWNTLYWVVPSQYANKPYDEVVDMLRGLGPANGFRRRMAPHRRPQDHRRRRLRGRLHARALHGRRVRSRLARHQNVG